VKKVICLVAVVVVVAGVWALSGRGEQPRKVSDLMLAKLKHAQTVLEGVALNDFEKIRKNADELILISKAAEWRAVRSPQYELHSNEFRRAAEALVDKAKEKNLDGASLAYVEMTLCCVKCHKYVREVRMTRLD
jgi:hypothetical protein